METYTLISHINEHKLPIKVISQTFISWEEAHDVNGNYKLGQHQDQAEVELVSATTPSGKLGYIKSEEANGILDCLLDYYKSKGGA